MVQVSSQPSDEVIAALLSIVRSTRRVVDPQIEHGQHWILRMLYAESGKRASELADSCGLDPSTVSRHLRQLEEHGRVTRQADPADRRAQLLYLTESGRAAVADATARRRRLLLEHLDRWDPADVTTLARLLNRLAADLSVPAEAPAAPSPVPDPARED